MRLLILILLLPFITQGQIVRTHPYYKPFAASCSYLLDQYSGAAAAYSLRKLDCDYAGSAIRVRRSSDNTEQDIGFVNGNLDTTALKTFVGTGGTDDGFVVTWYDQSSNGRNATQATSGNQPIIMNDGVIERTGGDVAIKWITNSYLATTTTAFSQLQTRSDFIVYKNESTSPSDAGVLIHAPSSGSDFNSTAAVLLYTNSGTVTLATIGSSGSNYFINTTTGSKTSYNLVSHIIVSSSGQLWRNNTSLGTDVATGFATNNTGALIIGTRYISGAATAYSLNGYFQEIVIYNSDQTSNRSGIQTNINTYWGVY